MRYLPVRNSHFVHLARPPLLLSASSLSSWAQTCACLSSSSSSCWVAQKVKLLASPPWTHCTQSLGGNVQCQYTAPHFRPPPPPPSYLLACRPPHAAAWPVPPLADSSHCKKKSLDLTNTTYKNAPHLTQPHAAQTPLTSHLDPMMHTRRCRLVVLREAPLPPRHPATQTVPQVGGPRRVCLPLLLLGCSHQALKLACHKWCGPAYITSLYHLAPPAPTW